MAIKDMVVYLNGCSDGVAIFDATNHTQLRRADLVEKVKKEKEFVIFAFFYYASAHTEMNYFCFY
jgi:6-phosphofructo-2-kinase